VVDHSALGDQAAGEFSTTKIVSGKAFADIFGLKRLHDVTPETETKVHICTIQGLVKRVLYAADSSEAPPIDQYDLMVVGEGTSTCRGLKAASAFARNERGRPRMWGWERNRGL
jgi:type I restriction enzyme R subunit